MRLHYKQDKNKKPKREKDKQDINDSMKISSENDITFDERDQMSRQSNKERKESFFTSKMNYLKRHLLRTG